MRQSFVFAQSAIPSCQSAWAALSIRWHHETTRCRPTWGAVRAFTGAGRAWIPRQEDARCLGTFRSIFARVRPFENSTMIKGGTPKGAPPTHKAPQRGSLSTFGQGTHFQEPQKFRWTQSREMPSIQGILRFFALVEEMIEISIVAQNSCLRQGRIALTHCTQPQFTVNPLEGNTLSISTERRKQFEYNYTSAHWTCLEVRKKIFSENVSKKVKIYPLTIWGSFFDRSGKSAARIFKCKFFVNNQKFFRETTYLVRLRSEGKFSLLCCS